MKRKFGRLLITGASGALGRVLRRRGRDLAENIRVTDIATVTSLHPGEEPVTGDLADADFARSVMAGVDAVVHLAAIGSEVGSAEIVRANITVQINVFAAAQAAGVPRMVWSSSNHAIGLYPTDQTIGVDAAPRPDGLYGTSKAFGEALAQYYWDRFGLETVSMRIGSCVQRPSNRRMLATWLSHADFLRLVEAALAAKTVGHTVVYGVSDNDARFWDNTGAAHLGYRPADNAESYRAQIERSAPPEGDNSPLLRYHGGDFLVTGR